jgi:starch synthase
MRQTPFDMPSYKATATSARALDVKREATSAAEPSPLKANTKLLFVTSELGDFVKAGGLGEVSAALPRELRALCDVRVLIPAYRQIRAAQPSIHVVRKMPATAGLPAWSLGRFTTDDGLTIYSVLCDELYDREGSPYGIGGEDFADNDIRFARLSLAAAEIASGEADPNWRPHVVHVNDWPSGLTPGYMKWKGLETPSILTIHNLAYQGLFPASRIADLGIPEHAFSMNGTEFHGQLSFLKSGIFYGSHVTTVSQTYAREITTPHHGCGLEGLLKTRMEEGRLHGIVNGIDDSWTSHVEALAESEDLNQWKEHSASEVRQMFNLAPSSGPLFSIISRLVHQKGIDLSLEAAESIVAKGGQLVVTGQGDPQIERAIEKLARNYPHAVAARIGFDDSEARKIYAASDFLLMPSRYEPCGLSQMYAQRSGALPIAHRTGGLADTIDDGRSGFLFSTLSTPGLKSAVGRALDAFRSKRIFQRMRRNAISKRFDWAAPTHRYATVYAKAIAK